MPRRARGNGNGEAGSAAAVETPPVAADLDEESELEYEAADPADASSAQLDVKQLKEKPLTELAALADELRVENAAGMRVQDLVFGILKAQAAKRGRIYAEGVLETLPDGFGFLRAPDQNYLAGPDDIYVSPSQIRRSFAEKITAAGDERPWRFQLDATIALPGAGGLEQTSTSTFFLTERLGGSQQYAGSKELDAIFALEQPLVDALWSLAYGGRDPGPRTEQKR